ncbi:hypothetical protein GCM10009864_30870 [Streptomyces lunalinharesii]|uniref:Transposase n=1 Tax=Streptomyces lunalinharesii TaxID=333384 RepID=A0ABN3RUT7_9ACTN
MTGSSAPINWAVNATIIAKSAASWTARLGAIPAEGTGEGSWQQKGHGGRPGTAAGSRAATPQERRNGTDGHPTV